MKVTSWNLLHGQSIPPSAQRHDDALHLENLALAGRYLKSIEFSAGNFGPDLLGLQEVDAQQSRSGGHSQVEALASQIGAKYWGYAPTVIGTPGSKWRTLHKQELAIHTHEQSSDLGATYGIGLISHIPIIRWHHLQLGRSRVGLPLAFPGEKGVQLVYVKDEPRVAIAAELENGFTVAVTHLSFVPLVNIYQLRKTERWLSHMPGKHLLMGDLNLPFNIPERIAHMRSFMEQLSYPSWGAKVQFDYILGERQLKEFAHSVEINQRPPISDHLPISVEITS